MTIPAAGQSSMPPKAKFGRIIVGVGALLVLGAVGLSLMSPEAAPANTLRGTSAGEAPARLEMRIPDTANQIREPGLAAFLGTGVWRAGACDGRGNFQAFNLAAAQVEVGSGHAGEGEKLQMLAARRTGDMVEVETRVCAPAPIGCNQTWEQYKVVGEDQLKEWHFEGRLPGQQPYVLVDQGQATDGSGEGRLFNRCPA